MSFFKQFPKVPYDIFRNGINQNVTDLFRSVKPVPEFIDDPSVYKFYEIKNGERPDIVSLRLYDTPNYYWTFFVVNSFLHDGLGVWPMSQEDLTEFMEKEYNGYAITTRPEIVLNSDGQVIDHRNSLAGRFEIGEIVTGVESGASGTLTQKNIDTNQLVIQNVANGPFIGDPTSPSNPSEIIVGQTSTDSVATYQVYKYIDAPFYYYLENDRDRRPIDNGVHIKGATSTADLAYVSNRQNIVELNDQRSKIRVIDPNYIEKFVNAYETVLNG